MFARIRAVIEGFGARRPRWQRDVAAMIEMMQCWYTDLGDADCIRRDTAQQRNETKRLSRKRCALKLAVFNAKTRKLEVAADRLAGQLSSSEYLGVKALFPPMSEPMALQIADRAQKDKHLIALRQNKRLCHAAALAGSTYALLQGAINSFAAMLWTKDLDLRKFYFAV